MEIKERGRFKTMKRIMIILLSLVMILNIPITNVFADHIEENNLNYYSYELFENSEKRYVDVINKKTKHVDYIVYDKKTGVLTINGRNKKCIVHANHSRNAASYKMNFTVDYQTAGLLAGSILAFTAISVSSISSLKKAISSSKIAAGTQVKGCLKYKFYKNNRKSYMTLTMKLGSGPNKSYSFKKSGMWMSNKYTPLLRRN